MHYPWWHVPHLTAPMLIAAVAVVHVLVSHYAVGGGLFLAMETGYAYRVANRDYLEYLRRHAWFFILITVVFGAITGVGIWWTIGLASPLATEMLIHIFVFAWGIEYVFFAIEIAAAFIFYYFWGRLDPRTHISIGWIYAGAAWISLVVITGITAFMLHPGGWSENRNLWTAFFNPQFLPQVLARTGGALLLASLYVYVHASLKAQSTQLRDLIERRSARPALLGSLLITIGGLWWYAAAPASARAALAAAAPLNIMMVALFALTVAVFVMLYVGPYRNPGWLTPGFAAVILASGMAALAVGEFVREAVRKPYVSYNVVLSNQVLADDVPAMRERGYLEHGVWTRALVARDYPQVMPSSTSIDEELLLALDVEERLELGRVLFQHHCNNCHASEFGLSAVAHLMRGWDERYISEVVTHPDKFHFFMPPWCGTGEEAQLLTEYLCTIAPGSPSGMNFGEAATGK